MWTALDLTSSGRFEAWVKLEAYPALGAEATIMAYGNAQGTRQIRMGVTSDGLLALTVTTPRSESRVLGVGRYLPLSRWFQVSWDAYGAPVSPGFDEYIDYENGLR